jgi:pSer/pThr/pTyr-binding forkhead associated (FHA) protein
MPDTLLNWFTRYIADPAKVEVALARRPVLLYEPSVALDGSIGEEDDDDLDFHTQSGLSPPSVGGLEPLAVVVEKTKDNAFQRRVTIGRTQNNDIVLDDPSVSRFHCWLHEETAGWNVSDAGSRNGTSVSGRRLSPKMPMGLSNGTRLKVGSVELQFHTAQGFLDVLKKRSE